MNRRGFLTGILAACAAPAIVRADSLMRIVPLDTTIVLPSAAQTMLAELEAADAFAAGLQLREWSQFDIVRDLTITRYDVIGKGADGNPVQMGVDLRGGSLKENREIARAVLADHLRHDRITPVRDMLALPDGARFI